MAVNPELLRWFVGSVAVPAGIGLGSAYIGYGLAIKKSRADARLASRRATYEELLPAMADLVASDAAEIASVYHDFDSQQHEDRAEADRERLFEKRKLALDTIDRVVLRGQLAASKSVLAALKSLRDDMDDARRAYNNDDIEYADAVEADLTTSRAALATIRRITDREA